jgi:hypothetical protein
MTRTVGLDRARTHASAPDPQTWARHCSLACVVEELASECAGEPFGEGVHVRRTDGPRRPLSAADSTQIASNNP